VGFKSVITRVAINAKSNHQFSHSLGGLVYAYVFGDRIGDLIVSGVAFDDSCYSTLGILGIENVLNYYAWNRMAARQTPIKITIGAATTLAGYLIEVTADVREARTRMWEFSLHMALIPRDTDPGRGVTDFGTSEVPSTTSGTTSEMTNGGILPGLGTGVTILPFITAGGYVAAGGPSIDMVSGGLWDPETGTSTGFEI
jgi:hypothetical protein